MKMNIKELVVIFNSYKLLDEIKLTSFSSFNSRDNFKNNISSRLNKSKGVYVFQTKRDGIIYIGSSGKVIDVKTKSNQGIRSRILNGSSPYKLEGELLKYKESNSNEYSEKSYRLKDLEIYFKETPDGIFKIPSVLEHFLIQLFFNKTGKLPVINRKL